MTINQTRAILSYPSEFGAELVKLAVHNRRMIFSEEKRKVAESVLERKRISRRDQSLQNIVSKIDKNLFVNSKWIMSSMNICLANIRSMLVIKSFICELKQKRAYQKW